MKIVGRGLFVGASGWQHVLETNKSALGEKWLGRTDFKARYDNKSNQQYVDELFANAGQTPKDALSHELLSALDKSSQSRAGVLSRVAESVPSDRADYNEAYVLIHYFGYLHRNPDDPPDTNLRGFNFWLQDLNQTGDYRSLTRSFIESGEYKDRGQKEVSSRQTAGAGGRTKACLEISMTNEK